MSNRPKKKFNLPSLLVLLVLIAVYFYTGGGTKGRGTATPEPAASVQTNLQQQATLAPLVTRTPAQAAQATPEPGSKDTVAAYLAEHGSLPDYYITKNEARDLGWSGGSLQRYAPGKLIGGDRFGNFEGLLPKKSGRVYYECDINTWGEQSRGAERIVYSNDGLIYYTDDHYESFELLEGTP